MPLPKLVDVEKMLSTIQVTKLGLGKILSNSGDSNLSSWLALNRAWFKIDNNLFFFLIPIEVGQALRFNLPKNSKSSYHLLLHLCQFRCCRPISFCIDLLVASLSLSLKFLCWFILWSSCCALYFSKPS
jgi:hypothetical protein